MTLSELKKIYQGKKVFLTGHTGFKGSWMLYVLHQLGAEVKGYALAPERKNDLFHLIKGNSLCDSVIADIRDVKRLNKEIKSFQPDFIFHLAAQPLVRLSYEKPLETIEVNALGTGNVLDSLKLVDKFCAAVMITTDKVYENKEWIYPYREEDRLGGYDPYSMSKACAELIISSYRNSFFHISKIKEHKKAIASARAGNVIGGGDWSTDRLIPDIAKALSIGEKIHIRNPKAIRPWQHVIECISGYLELGAALKKEPAKYSEAWNFGPYSQDNITVDMVLNDFITEWGKTKSKIQFEKAVLHEAKFLALDISKTVNTLQWKPKYGWKEAVQITAKWYSTYHSKPKDINVLMEATVKNYFN